MDDKKPSRSEYVVKNASVTIIIQVAKNILGFISRTIFIKILGAEYLGVNGLFTEILTILSFAELGIGNAMVFSLYKPLAENDVEKIKSLMKLYAKSYYAIGTIIAVLGVLVIPFLDNIVGDVSYVKENITLLYVMFLLNSVLSYFFVYKKSLIIADQKNYIVDIYQQIFYAMQVVVQSVFLLITKQFIPYLIIVIVFTVLNNLWVARKANKMYPCLQDKNVKPLEKKEISEIIRNIKALVIYKVGGIILESTDSIFISAMVNVVTVGLYSNYKMVVNVFKTVGSQVMSSIVASVGNLNASASKEKKEQVFYEMLYVNAWFYGFTATGLFLFLNGLVKVWLGDLYLIDSLSVFAICLYYYVANMHYTCYTYRTTAGLFVFGKYVPIMAAVLNIIMNAMMGIKWGLTGILLASTFARVFTYEVIDPLLIYKRIFNKSATSYFVKYLLYIVLIVVDCIVCKIIIEFIPISGMIGLVLKACVMAVGFNVIFFIVTFRSKSFRAIKARLIHLINEKRNKND